MRPGPHAAPDGSFGRSAGTAAGRGALLLGVAVVLGIVLLNAADDVPARQRVEVDEASTTTTSEVVGGLPSTAPLRAPREIKVIAANGTRVKGAASKVSDTLRTAGYNVLSPTDAPKADASVVYFTTGFEREAVELARSLGIAISAVQAMPVPAPVGDSRGADAIVVVGPDLAGGAGEDSTTTTARGRTSSTTVRSSGSTSSSVSSVSSTSTTSRSTSTTLRPTSTTARPAPTTTR